MQLRTSAGRRKKIETPSLKSRREFNEGLGQEHKLQYVEAYLSYRAAAKTLEDVGPQQWTREDYIHLMGVYSKLLDIIEDDLLEYNPVKGDSAQQHRARVRDSNLKIATYFAKRAWNIYATSPDIKAYDFCLTAIRASLMMEGHFWYDVVVDNDPKPTRMPDYLEKMATMLRELLVATTAETVLETTKNARIYLVSRCYLMMAAGYLRLADINTAKDYCVYAALHAMRATEKNGDYFDILFVAFNHLHQHANFHEEYAIVSFARRVLCMPALYNPTFLDLSAQFQAVCSGSEVTHPGGLVLWKLLCDVIQERLDAGAFTKGRDGQYGALFPDSDFKIAMEHPYYRERFEHMRKVIIQKEYEHTHPVLTPALSSDHDEREEMVPVSVISGLMMNSRLFSPTLRRNLSSEWLNWDEFNGEEESESKRTKFGM